MYEPNYSSSSYEKIVGQAELLNFALATGLGEGKFWIQTGFYPAS